jgi:hypothetical protein
LIFFGEFAGLVAAFADNDGAGQPSCNQEGFVAEVARCAIGIDFHRAVRFATVSAGENVECDAALLEKFA